MKKNQISDQVFWVGAKDWDRQIFDEMVPLQDGTSYNAYVVRGTEKTALIDTVEPAVKDQLFRHLKKIGITTIDYVIANHAEQDHSGSIPDLLQAFPEAKLVTNDKCAAMLKDFCLVTGDKLHLVKNGDTLDLGGKTLEFCSTPWVHWPETMSTYLREDGILFSCDFFGSHTAAADLSNTDHFYIPAKRYYAEIMAPFRSNVRTNIARIEKFPLRCIAPSHGFIFHQPEQILNAYKEWSSDEVKNEAVIAYISMHQSTKTMAEYLREQLTDRGIDVHFFNLSVADIGDIAMHLVDAATFIVGASTTLNGLHPAGMSIAYTANALRPKTKFVSLVTSFGWGEKGSQTFSSALTNFKAEILPPVIAKGFPKEPEHQQLEHLAETIAEKHRSIGIL